MVTVRAARHRARLAWWPTALPLMLMLVSDYKLRARPVEQTIAGRPDLTILVEIAVYGIAALYLYAKFGLRAPRRRPSTLLLVAWLFVGYQALTVLWSPYPELAAVRGTQLVITAALCYVLATRATTAELHRLAHAFVIVVLLSVVIGLVHQFPRTIHTQTRFNWLYVHPVTAGIYLAIAVLLVTAYLTRRGEMASARMWPAGAYVASLAILVGALLGTGTRGAALGCAFGLLAMLATSRGPRGRAEMIVMAVPVLVITVLALSTQILGFMTRGETAEQLETLNSRTELWALAIEAVQHHLLFGWGMSSARGIFYEQTNLGGGHNAFVNVLVDGGVVGLIVFLLLLFELSAQVLSWTRVRAVRTDAGMLLGLIILLVVDGLTAEYMATQANVASVWLFIIVAWTRVLARANQEAVEAEARKAEGPLQLEEAHPR